jgi:hypothetical protein
MTAPTTSLRIRLTLIDPPAGVTYGIQRGKGAKYSVDFAQTPKRGDVTFDFAVDVVERNGAANFLGEYVQGPPGRRFIYVDVGKYAGQDRTPWARRTIIRLDGITSSMVRRASKAGHRLAARIRGTGSDGGPSCATVAPIGGWTVERFMRRATKASGGR